jgi:hypothetical protein
MFYKNLKPEWALNNKQKPVVAASSLARSQLDVNNF